MDTQARLTTRAVPRLAPRLWLAFAVLAVAAAIAAQRPAAAQDNLATAEELRELVGPIALYPDDLVAIVLPASTYPLQVVQAARFLEDREADASLKPNEDWDDSVVALLNYPEVIELMNDDLDWTYDLGTAVLNQRADVLSAIQDFRDEAYDAGNLRSDERQTITRADDSIEIKPADPQVIYVPYYEPERVVVYQPAPVYYYYPVAYPVYYYPYPAHHHFHTGFFWGVNTWFSIGWHSHYLHAYDPFYYGHPYYGRTYYHPFYVRNVYVNVNHYRYPNYVWEPRYRYGGRPVARGSEGRVYTADRDRTPRHGVLDSNAARTREGTVDRAREGAAPGTANGTPQPRRGVPSESYRNRNATGTQPQTTESAQANGTRSNTPNGRSTLAQPPMGRSTQANEASNGRSTRAESPPGRTHPAARTQARETGQPQARQPGDSSDAASTPPSRTYRSGGGMSQALERSRAAAQANVSPRASEGSTGMPRESARNSAPPRQQSAPPPRQQSFDTSSHGGGTSAQRSDPGGGQRGNAGGHDGGNRGNSGGGNSGGNSRGGGGGERAAHPAARTR